MRGADADDESSPCPLLSSTLHHPLFQGTLASQSPPPCSLFCSLYAISGSFDSSFDVLFNFPSRYCFAIGLCAIFSFTRSIPGSLRTTHKVRDSKKGADSGSWFFPDGAVTLSGGAFQRTWKRQLPPGPFSKGASEWPLK